MKRWLSPKSGALALFLALAFVVASMVMAQGQYGPRKKAPPDRPYIGEGILEMMIAPGPDQNAEQELLCAIGLNTVTPSPPRRGENRARVIDIELVAMNLTGYGGLQLGDVQITLDAGQPSADQVTLAAKKNPTLGQNVDSFFDVFIEINVVGNTYTPDSPIPLTAKLNAWPPKEQSWMVWRTQPIACRDSQGQVGLWIWHCQWVPFPYPSAVKIKRELCWIQRKMDQFIPSGPPSPSDARLPGQRLLAPPVRQAVAVSARR